MSSGVSYKSIYPLFKRGRVLKKESLEYLRDFPCDLASIAHASYSDGILFGFSVCWDNGYIVVSKGAVKYCERIITVPDSRFLLEDFDRPVYIKLVINECENTEDFQSRKIQIKLDSAEVREDYEMEIGRFDLARGLSLRCNHDSVKDFSTIKNTLNISNVYYASFPSQTLHPKIVKKFAQTIAVSSSEPTDTAFALMCFNSTVIHKESILWYIAKKTNSDYKDYPLKELYDKLVGLTQKNEPPPERKKRIPRISG